MATSMCEASDAGPMTYDHEMDIPADRYAVILHFRAGSASEVEVVFNVTGGGPVDLLVLDESLYHAYRIGANVSGLPGSALDQSQGACRPASLTPGVEYYLVVDNTDLPMGGASPMGKVRVAYGSSVAGAEGLEESGEPWPLYLVIGSIVLMVIVVAYLVWSGGREDAKAAAQVHPLAMRRCPQCGQGVATYEHKCPRCGKEW